MPPRGGRGGGGGPRGGMGGGPRGGMGGMPPGMGGRPRSGMGGMPPGMGGAPRGRGCSPIGTIIGLVVVAIIIFSSVISSLPPIVWVALAVVALVAIILVYKYKSDRAKAAETQKILETDLGKAPSGLSDLEDKYQ
ncbi:MAG: hypothetical protein R3Y62_03345 [Eubacteriales bacterium]